MNDIIKIPNKYKVSTNKDRSEQMKNSIFKSNTELAELVERFTWIASVKPALGNVEPTLSDSIRYEEIQIFHIVITDAQKLYNICAPIYKAIRYPCLLIIQYKEQYTFSACKFSAGKLDYNDNVDLHMDFSHWVFPENISENGQNFVEKINHIISSEGDLYSLYTNLFNEILYFRLGGITKAHVNRLAKSMNGQPIKSNAFWDKLTPYKKHHMIGNGKSAKYAKRAKSYVYSYDKEELWHTFMTDETYAMIIKKRRYRDIEDMILEIDNGYYEY